MAVFDPSPTKLRRGACVCPETGQCLCRRVAPESVRTRTIDVVPGANLRATPTQGSLFVRGVRPIRRRCSNSHGQATFAASLANPAKHDAGRPELSASSGPPQGPEPEKALRRGAASFSQPKGQQDLAGPATATARRQRNDNRRAAKMNDEARQRQRNKMQTTALTFDGEAYLPHQQVPRTTEQATFGQLPTASPRRCRT